MLKFEKELFFYSGSAVLSTGKTIDCYDSNSFSKRSASQSAVGHDKFRIDYRFEFGIGLTRVLGFEKTIEDMAVEPGNSKTSLFEELQSEYLIDVCNGLNFIFVDCEQIEPVQLGFSYRNNLLVCPINLGSAGETVSYSPSDHQHKLKNGIIDKMHITMNDINGGRIFLIVGKCC